MKISSQKFRLYAIIVVGGVAWLLVDQLSAPAEAEAATDASASLVVQPAVVPLKPAATSQLRERLENVLRTTVHDPDIDPFAVPKAPQQQPVAIAAEAPVPAAQWKLSGIMRFGPDRGIAIVEGQAVNIGQVFRGYRLIALGEQHATLLGVTDNRRVTLRLSSN